MAQNESLAFAPGTLREYETIYILKPETTNEGVADVNDKVKGIIEERGGKVLKVNNWGKRRLAYEIAKQLKGIYLHWLYLGSPDIVAEFERNMKLLDPCIRWMTVRIDEDIDPSARPSEMDDDAYESAATTAADEEELMLGRTEGEEGEEGEAKAEGEEANAKTIGDDEDISGESDDAASEEE